MGAGAHRYAGGFSSGSVSIRAWAHAKLIRQIVLTVTWTAELKSSNATTLAVAADTVHAQDFDLLPYSSQRWRSQCVAKAGTKVDPLPNWTLHDLRRTAKTLMARAGVRPDISERVLGHVMTGVEGTYDRHSYAEEKREALEKLAAMIERILNPSPSSVAIIAEHRIRA
jgi:integrase